MPGPNKSEPQRLLLRIPEAATSLGVGTSTLYELIAAGEIPVVHIGRSVRVPVEALEQWASSLQEAE